MSSRTKLPWVTLLAWALGGCAGKRVYSPWLAPRDSILTATHTIALSPLRVPDDLEAPEPVEALFDSLITGALRAAGLTVVPPDLVSEIWNRGADSMGGYFDPMTGRADTSKLNPLRRYFKHRLRSEHAVDLVLFPEIVVVGAPYADGQASWDGTSQAVAGWLKILASAITNTPLPAGTAEGLSLDVQIEGMDGGSVFNHRAGIELWAKPSGSGDLSRVPRERLFRDRKRSAKAVKQILESLLGDEQPSH
jgi:hypothetical protein